MSILIPLHTYFKKDFPPDGIFIGQVVRVRPTAHLGKSRRVLYQDGDSEDLTIPTITTLIKLNGEPDAEEVKEYERDIRDIEHDVGNSDDEEEIIDAPREAPKATTSSSSSDQPTHPQLSTLSPYDHLGALVFHSSHLSKFLGDASLPSLQPFIATVTMFHETKRRNEERMVEVKYDRLGGGPSVTKTYSCR